MKQSELNRAVAAATGETVRTIRSLGFVPLEPIPIEREALTVDWDDIYAMRSCAILPIGNPRCCDYRARRRTSASKVRR